MERNYRGMRFEHGRLTLSDRRSFSVDEEPKRIEYKDDNPRQKKNWLEELSEMSTKRKIVLAGLAITAAFVSTYVGDCVANASPYAY